MDDRYKAFYFSRFLYFHNGDVFLFKPTDVKSHTGNGIDKCINYRLSIKQIISLLDDYLFSRNPYENTGTFESQYFTGDKYIYGMDIYRQIKEKIGRGDYLEYIPYKTFSIMLDHKKMMVSRINYLAEEGYLDTSDKSLAMFREVHEIAKILLDISLKYNLNCGKSILGRISGKLTYYQKRKN
jgi:hypothetical protein